MCTTSCSPTPTRERDEDVDEEADDGISLGRYTLVQHRLSYFISLHKRQRRSTLYTLCAYLIARRTRVLFQIL